MRSLVATATLSIALAGAPVTAHAALPAAATLGDAKGDGDSRPFDVQRMRGTKVGNQLVLVMKVHNITRKNTAPTYGAQSSVVRTIFGFHLRVNGQRRPTYMVSRGGWDGDEAVVRLEATRERVDCTPGVGGSFDTSRPGSLRLNPKNDTARLTVPLSCIPEVRTVSFTGYTMDSRDGAIKSDHAYRPGSEISRWSRQFSLR